MGYRLKTVCKAEFGNLCKQWGREENPRAHIRHCRLRKHSSHRHQCHIDVSAVIFLPVWFVSYDVVQT